MKTPNCLFRLGIWTALILFLACRSGGNPVATPHYYLTGEAVNIEVTDVAGFVTGNYEFSLWKVIAEERRREPSMVPRSPVMYIPIAADRKNAADVDWISLSSPKLKIAEDVYLGHSSNGKIEFLDSRDDPLVKWVIVWFEPLRLTYPDRFVGTITYTQGFIERDGRRFLYYLPIIPAPGKMIDPPTNPNRYRVRFRSNGDGALRLNSSGHTVISESEEVIEIEPRDKQLIEVELIRRERKS